MSEYINQAKKFLRDSRTRIRIKFDSIVEGFPNSDDVLMRNKYKVTLTRNKKQYTFPFYDSHANYIKGKEPTVYDVLSCLQSYEPEWKDMWEMANDMGYIINSQTTYENVKNTFHGIWDEYRNLQRLYEPEWLEKLGEIQ